MSEDLINRDDRLVGYTQKERKERVRRLKYLVGIVVFIVIGLYVATKVEEIANNYELHHQDMHLVWQKI